MKAIKTILTASTFDVFEKMFYIFLETTDEGCPTYDFITSIRFSGPLTGEIRLYLSDSLALTMAKNMLSLDQIDITQAMKEDCSKEAVNMISGQFLRTLDATQVFHLTVPHCLTGTFGAESAAPESDSDHCLNFESENAHLCVRASLTSPSPVSS